MIRIAALTLALIGQAGTLAAETLIATRRLPARTVLAAADLAVADHQTMGALSHPDEAIGLEARVMLYPGRPIRPGDLIPAAAVERNQIVVLLFAQGGLNIATEGRALARGAVGDRIRVMNLASRTTVTGTIHADGHIVVGPSDHLLQAVGGQ